MHRHRRDEKPGSLIKAPPPNPESKALKPRFPRCTVLPAALKAVRTVIFPNAADCLTARAPVLALILPLCDAWARQHFVPGPITSDDVIRRSGSVPLSTNRDVMHGFPLIDFV